MNPDTTRPVRTFTAFPPSGLHRCPMCDYDLTGLPAAHQCPECGFQYDDATRVWGGVKPQASYYRAAATVTICGLAAVFQAYLGYGMMLGGAVFKLGFLIPLTIAAIAIPTVRRRRRWPPLAAVTPNAILHRNIDTTMHTYPLANVAGLSLKKTLGRRMLMLRLKTGQTKRIDAAFRNADEMSDFLRIAEERLV